MEETKSGEPKDPVEAFDAAHGKAGIDHKDSGLTEAGNKVQGEPEPFKLTGPA